VRSDEQAPHQEQPGGRDRNQGSEQHHEEGPIHAGRIPPRPIIFVLLMVENKAKTTISNTNMIDESGQDERTFHQSGAAGIDGPAGLAVVVQDRQSP
jgi:hypothetical protein